MKHPTSPEERYVFNQENPETGRPRLTVLRSTRTPGFLSRDFPSIAAYALGRESRQPARSDVPVQSETIGGDVLTEDLKKGRDNGAVIWSAHVGGLKPNKLMSGYAHVFYDGPDTQITHLRVGDELDLSTPLSAIHDHDERLEASMPTVNAVTLGLVYVAAVNATRGRLPGTVRADLLPSQAELMSQLGMTPDEEQRHRGIPFDSGLVPVIGMSALAPNLLDQMHTQVKWLPQVF